MSRITVSSWWCDLEPREPKEHDGGPGPGDLTALGTLLGAARARVRAALGEPGARRRAGESEWWVFDLPGASLRLRFGAPAGDPREPRLSSWTLSYGRGRARLEEALDPLGLWPAGSPDVHADRHEDPIVRRALPGADGSGEISLTVTSGPDGFRRVALFDEAPDWR